MLESWIIMRESVKAFKRERVNAFSIAKESFIESRFPLDGFNEIQQFTSKMLDIFKNFIALQETKTTRYK